MPTFYLLDHSLKGVGGHHFDYADQVLHAAQAAGFDIVLATNRRFQERHRLPRDWSVESPFRYTTYCRFALYASSGSRSVASARKLDAPDLNASPGNATAWLHPKRWPHLLRDQLNAMSRRRRIRHFAQACHKVFRKFPLAVGDQVFLPTLSEFDLHGLSAYLTSDASSLVADWHLQFHYNVFDGREPEYAEQRDRLDALRQELVAALRPLGRHRLQFYNTSAPLADQYNRLGLSRFHELTYPINQAFHTQPRVDHPRPLKVTCPGAVRQEKGQPLLSRLLENLWDDQFSTGQMQLVVQSNKSWFRIPLPPRSAVDADVHAPAASISVAPVPAGPGPLAPEPPTAESAAPEPVVYVPHPLSPSEYIDLVCGADIGLLMYDSRRYYARRAGILGELLSAGVPVIVPAGCWLSQQLAESVLRHRELLDQHWPVVARLPLTLADDALQVPETGELQLELDIPASATDVVIHWGWGRIEKPGSHLRVRGSWQQAPDGQVPVGQVPVGQVPVGQVPVGQVADGQVADGQVAQGRAAQGRAAKQAFPVASAVVRSWSEIVSTWDGKGNPRSSIAVPCPGTRRRLRLCWSNAYEQGSIQLREVGCTCLDASQAVGGHCPTSAVGLIAADQDDVPRLLREMATHYRHYRESAQAFSRRWRAAHTAQRTVAQLQALAASLVRPNAA